MTTDTQTISLKQLAAEWQDAKAQEEAARRDRIAIEDLIATQLASEKIEGTVTAEIAPFRVTVTNKLIRSVDSDELSKEWEHLTVNAQRSFRWKADVDLKHFRALQELAPTDFAKVAPFVTTKPAKPSVKVELFE